jgi:hypothetical protein
MRARGRPPQQLSKTLGTLTAIVFGEQRVGLASQDRPPPTLLLLVPDPPAATRFGTSHEPFPVIHGDNVLPSR